MPRPTASHLPRSQPPAADILVRPALWAAGYAAAELAAGLLVGGFFALGRAEALIFLALRPWLLVAAAWLVIRWPLAQRAGFYVAALLLATAGECLLLLALGAEAPWKEAARGLFAGLLLAAGADAAAQLGSRLWGRAGTGLGLALALLLFVLPAGPRIYERVAIAQAELPTGAKPDLMLMTGLPLAWGETGPFDPHSRPAAAYGMLERLFAIRPLDVLGSESLGTGKLLLLAQPRRLAPTELAALDVWVRRGGRVLILADPQLDWPSALPLGDIRRPPPVHLLWPLLNHWGVRVEGGESIGPEHRQIRWRDQRLRVALSSPGSIKAPQPCFNVNLEQWALQCRIGEGVAVIVADADWLQDALWAPFGPGRHQRTADNPFLLAAWLDALGGHDPHRALATPVSWIDVDAHRFPAILLALLPVAILATLAGLIRLRRRR